jgi:AbrB family looped-hinge helix DNA binding protein
VIPKEIREKFKEGSKVNVNLEKDGRIIINVERLTIDDIVAGKESVRIKEIEEALGFEDNV